MIYTAIMGHGTVGSGVAEILIEQNKRISESIKDEIEVKYILDLREFNGLYYSDKFTKDFNVILNDDSIKIVVEVMGGVDPAYQYVKSCLEAGKNVVTSNKELVAEKGAQLIKIANEKNVSFLFEASVGGGIPLLHPILQCLKANEITKITGILNGTTNYILDKMIVDNMDFDTALRLAQEKGFAERNPAADIEGFDACRKIAILATVAFGKHVYPEQVATQGITDVTLDDIEYANGFNCSVKLIGKTEKLSGGKICASVAPTLVGKENMLSNVNGVYNAVTVIGDAVGDVMFCGKGAGKMPTASAVVADVIECARHLSTQKYVDWEDGENGYVVEDNSPAKYYVYAKSNDFDKLVASFEKTFSDNCQVIKNKYKNEIAFISNDETKQSLNKKIKQLNSSTVKIMNTLF